MTGRADDGRSVLQRGRHRRPGRARPHRAAGGPARDDGFVWLTSVIDLRAHLVTDVELSRREAMDAGRYTALCGHLVAPAALIAPDGEPCRSCAALRRVTRSTILDGGR